MSPATSCWDRRPAGCCCRRRGSMPPLPSCWPSSRSRWATPGSWSGSLSGGQRQLVAMAKALIPTPRLLVLDEPTASLGAKETAQVEGLITRLRDQGSSILLASRDNDQMLRLADRILVLRHGRLVAELDPAQHPSRRAQRGALRPAGGLIGAPPADSSARTCRPAGIGRSVVEPVADPVRARSRHWARRRSASTWSATNGWCAPPRSASPPRRWRPGRGCRSEPRAGPPAWRRSRQERVIEGDLRSNGAWKGFDELAESASIASSWSVPVTGPAGVSAVITVFRADPGEPPARRARSAHPVRRLRGERGRA